MRKFLKMGPVQQLSDQGFREVARRFHVLGEPGRLKILDLLRRSGELAVTAIAHELGCSQSHASRQLALLHDVGFVQRRRAHATVYYSIADLDVFALCGIVCGRLEQAAAGSLHALFIPGQST